MLVPLNRTGRLGVRVEGAGEGALSWNGRRVAAGGLPVQATIAAGEIRRGINEARIDGATVAKLVLDETSDWPPAWSTVGAP